MNDSLSSLMFLSLPSPFLSVINKKSTYIKNKGQPKPVWLSGRASVCGLKGPGFDSGLGHVHWLRAHPRWGVCRRQLVDVSLSLTFLALYPSPFLSVEKSIKYILIRKSKQRTKESH